MQIVQLSSAHPAFDPRVNRFARIFTENGWKPLLIYWGRGQQETYLKANTLGVLSSPKSLAYPPFFAIPVFLFLFYLRSLGLLIKLHPDVCVAHQLDTLPVALVGRVFCPNLRVIFDNEDVYSLMVARAVPHLVASIIHSVECRLAAMSNLCVFPNLGMRDYVCGKMNCNSLVVPNIPEPEFRGIDKKAAKRELNLQKSFTVGHFGLLRTHRGIETLVKAVGLLTNEGVNTTCLMTTGGSLLPELQRLASQVGATRNIRFLGRVEREQLPLLLSACDASAILHTQGDPMNWLVNPNKLYESMLLGVPVIGPNFGEIARIIREADCGLVVDPDSPHEVANVIKSLLENQELALRLGKNGIKAMETTYAWEGYKVNLTNAIRELSQGK